MKIYLILFILVFSGIQLKAQEFTHEADSLISEIIFQKTYKFNFFKGVRTLNRYSPEKDLNNPNCKEFGDENIWGITFAMGEWAVKPDFKVYLSDYKSPWKDYTIYRLFYPFTPLNDKLNTLYAFRKFWLGSPSITDYLPPFAGGTYAYSSKTGNIKEIVYLTNLNKKSDLGLFYKLNPDYKGKLSYAYKKDTVLSPQNKNEIYLMLKSELMKNIYGYRFIKSGLLDSITDQEGYLKEHISLFPLLDSLIPDFRVDLHMDYEEVNCGDRYTYYRFYYPGQDLLNSAWRFKISRVWEPYIPLEPGFYVVSYDPYRQLVHFVSGKNIFLTRYSPRLFPCAEYCTNQLQERKISPEDSARYRKYLVAFKTLSYFSDNFFWDWDEDQKVLTFTKEDTDYWYYTLISDIPEMKFNIAEEGDMIFPVIRGDTKQTHRTQIRMSKQNMEIVDVLESVPIKEEKEKKK